jgi:hypothetical protein
LQPAPTARVFIDQVDMFRVLVLTLAVAACEQGAPNKAADRRASPVGSTATPAASPTSEQESAPCPRKHDELDLTAVEGGVIGCWSEFLDPWSETTPYLCLRLTSSGAQKPAAEPRPVTRTTLEVRGESVCIGATCKKLGKTVARALHRHTRAEIGVTTGVLPRSANGEPRATADLGVLVTGEPLSALRLDTPLIPPLDDPGPSDEELFGPKAWHVARDRRIALRPPAGYAKRGATIELESIDVMGNLLVVSWMKDICGDTDPCQLSVLVDASGAHMRRLSDVGQLIQLDDTRTVVMPSQLPGVMTVLDGITGKQLAALELLKQGEEVDERFGIRLFAAKLDANTLVASWYSALHSGWDIVWIATPVGQPPTISSRHTVAGCL